MTGLQTYNNQDKRESLLSILRDVSPNLDNYFVTNLGTAPAATNTVHEWGVYNTARPTSVTTVAEGAAATYADLTAPVKTHNVTAIVSEPVRVSGTEKAISTITGEDPLAFQKDRALKRLKASMEWLTINGVYASGSSGVARGMTGIDGMISTNVTARASGTSFSEIELNDIMQASYDEVGSEYIADILVCPMVLKRVISSYFTAGNSRVVPAVDKRIDGEIRVYDSAVGQTVAIIPHKDVRSANNTVTVYALREEMYKHAFLKGREPMWQEYDPQGDRSNGQYLTEFTLVNFAQRASVKRTGYRNTLT